MYDTLAILCRDISEAKSASITLPPKPRLQRFFVFLGRRPNEAELTFLEGQDTHLTIDDALTWSQSPLQVGVRAALLYATGWNILFCTGQRPASESDLAATLAGISLDGNARHGGCWGASREHLVLHGLDDVFFATLTKTELSMDQANPSLNLDGPVDTITLLSAMSGHKVSANGVLAALRETVPLSAVKLDHNVTESVEPYLEFLIALENSSAEKDSRFPTATILGTFSLPSRLTEVIRSMPKVGAVVICVNKDSPQDEYLAKHTPYRRFQCVDGWDALVFGGEG